MNTDLILREELAVQRTILANQSTFLAFLRTSMYFLVAGLTIGSFLKGDQIFIIMILFFAISGLILILGIANYLHQSKKIRRAQTSIGNPQPHKPDQPQ